MGDDGTWHKDKDVTSIFSKAAGLASDAERAAYLDQVEARDPALRVQVEKLLAAHEHAGDFMRDGAPAEGPGTQIGPYKLLQVIGEGGMGTVYMADQTHPVARRVALKIVKPGMDSGEVIARFEAERQALALMEHPNIAKVLDAGATDSGRPYFAMELVKGVPITEYCDEHGFAPRERLELFAQVCHAVHHAHQKGVIHRDLKPANVLVADYDDKAVPKVIDFGIAKAFGQKLTEKTLFTKFGQIVGTFEYMSPEQAKFNQLDIDTRSDIYALGVLLYELLTGTTPFDKGRLQVAGFEEVLRIIREEEPPTPSMRISALGDRTASVAASRGSSPNQLRRDLHGELDWIVMRAMDKERNRRYESAAALADDIQRFLDDEAVEACPPSTAYRVRKFVRRNRGLVIAASVVLAVLVLGLAGTTVGLVKAKTAEGRASRERDAQQRLNFRMAVDRGLAHCHDGQVGHGMLWLAHALALCPADDPAMERLVRANLNAWRRELNTLEAIFPHEGAVIAVAFSKDGSRIATGSYDRTVQIWDARTGERVGEPLRHHGDVHEVAFSADGTRLLSADYARTAYLWDVASGRLLREFPHGKSPRDAVVLAATGGVLGAAFRPTDENQIVTVCGDGTARILDARNGLELARLPHSTSHMVHDVVVSTDGRWILTSSMDNNVRLWDFDSRALLATFRHRQQVGTADFRGNGQIVTGISSGHVFVWSIEAARADADKVLEVAAEEYLHGRWLHRGTVHRMRIGPDGKRILSGSLDTTALIWDPDRDTEEGAHFEHEAAVWGVAFAPDGARIATASDDNMGRLWQPAVRQSVRVVRHERPFVDHEAVFSPDGRYVLVKTDNETAVVRDAATKELVCTLRHGGGIRAMAVTPDRSRVLTGGATGACVLWDAEKNAVSRAFRHGSGVWSVDISRDGRRTLTGGFDGMVQIRDTRDGALRHELASGSRIQGVAFGASQRFAVARSVKSSLLYDSAEARPAKLGGHTSAVYSICFSRDGTRFASGSHDKTARVWDVETASLISTMRHPGPLNYSLGTALNRNGSLLATGCEDGTARIWDVATGRTIGPALRHDARVCMVAFTDGGTIRAGTATGTVSFWDAECAPIQGDPERIRLWVEVITGSELNADRSLRALGGDLWRARRARLRELGGAPVQEN